MTFAIGRRFIVVDGVERWKQAEVDAHVVPALAGLPPDTTVAFFAREDGRAKVPAALPKAVKKAGGDVVEQATVKARELPKWALAEAQRLGRRPGAAPPRRRWSPRSASASSGCCASWRSSRWSTARAPGSASRTSPRRPPTPPRARSGASSTRSSRATGARSSRAFLELREQGEAVGRLIPLMARRLREVLAIADRLEAGESPAQVKSSTKGSPWALDRRIKEARATDPDALRRRARDARRPRARRPAACGELERRHRAPSGRSAAWPRRTEQRSGTRITRQPPAEAAV